MSRLMPKLWRRERPEPSEEEQFAAYQKLQKEQLNARLNHNQNGQSFGQDVSSNATELQEKNFAKNATLIGGNAGESFAGIESLESKVDDAGRYRYGGRYVFLR